MQKSLVRLINASRYSWDGFRATWRDEEAFRQIVVLACVGFPLALVLARTWVECVLLFLPLVLCIIVELLNTAIENVVDRISLEKHELSKKAKDMGSAAQFTAQMFLLFTWLGYGIYRIAD